MKYLAIVVVALGLLLLPLLVAAQSSDPINDTFDADVQGWAPTQAGNTSVNWLNYKDFGALFWHTEAYGVLQAEPIDRSLPETGTGSTHVSKSVYLQPGSYMLHMRMATETSAYFVDVSVSGSGVVSRSYLNQATEVSWAEYTTEVVAVYSPGLVTWTIGSTDGFYLDWVRVEAVATGGSPTPTLRFVYDTPTPLPYTPIPTDQQATPIPVGTQFCQEATATPETPAYGSTPTPPENDWGYLDRFSGGIGQGWSISGSGVVYSDQMGPDNAQGALAINYSADSSPASSLSGALAFDQPITPTFYVDGYAMADAIPIGASATVHVWLRDAIGNWYAGGSANFSAAHWYPFHITVTDPAGATAPYSAFAVTVSRSDNPSGVAAFIDNLYIYGTLTRSPDCSGGYPPGTTTFGSTPVSPIGVYYPIGKACPPSTMSVPNNFWGPFFEWANLQFLKITAFYPDHTAGSFAGPIETMANSPLWVYASVATMLFDIRPILILAVLLILLEGVRLLYSIWRIILKIIPMAG